MSRARLSTSCNKASEPGLSGHKGCPRCQSGRGCPRTARLWAALCRAVLSQRHAATVTLSSVS
eukprot:6183461-Pleurochrysis_carterae.AAC.12